MHEKTGGNPFFLIQFLQALVAKKVCSHSIMTGRGGGGISIASTPKAIPKTSSDLMVGKLRPIARRGAEGLQQLACLGDRAELTTLSLVHGTSEQQVHADLREAVRLELIERLDSSYKFVHDRVQEAAYALIPEDLRGPRRTCGSGGSLVAHTPPCQREKATFEIVNPTPIAAMSLINSQGRARTTRRAQSDRGPARQGVRRLCLGTHLSGRRRRTVGRRIAGSAAASSSPSRWN